MVMYGFMNKEPREGGRGRETEAPPSSRKIVPRAHYVKRSGEISGSSHRYRSGMTCARTAGRYVYAHTHNSIGAGPTENAYF